MMPGTGSFVLLILLGGWIASDSTSVGQLMVSRPLIAATLGGLVVGDPMGGAILGLILEALHLTVLPFGAARYPEMGPAAVAAAAVLAGHTSSSALVLVAVIFALAWGWVSGMSIRVLRQFNVRIALRASATKNSPVGLELWHGAAIAADVLRGMVLVALGVPMVSALMTLTATTWALGEGVAQITIWAAVAGGLGASLRLFGSNRAVLFISGILCGLLFLLLG